MSEEITASDTRRKHVRKGWSGPKEGSLRSREGGPVGGKPVVGVGRVRGWSNALETQVGSDHTTLSHLLLYFGVN